MPRKKTILQSIYPYHVTARCINKEWFRLNIGSIWSIFSDYLFILKFHFQFEIHSFVLMNNHFHLIVQTPLGNLSEGMNYFLRETSKEISFQSKRINQTFGGPYCWTLLQSHCYFLNTYKYVYRNPVEAGLSKHCEMYPYSTLAGLLGYQKMNIPLAEDTLLFTPQFNPTALYWLNAPNKTMHNHVGDALTKNNFQYFKKRGSNKFVVDAETIY